MKLNVSIKIKKGLASRNIIDENKANIIENGKKMIFLNKLTLQILWKELLRMDEMAFTRDRPQSLLLKR